MIFLDKGQLEMFPVETLGKEGKSVYTRKISNELQFLRENSRRSREGQLPEGQRLDQEP